MEERRGERGCGVHFGEWRRGEERGGVGVHFGEWRRGEERGGVGVHFGEWRRGEEREGGSILVSGGEERERDGGVHFDEWRREGEISSKRRIWMEGGGKGEGFFFCTLVGERGEDHGWYVIFCGLQET